MNVTVGKPILVLLALLLVFAGIGIGSLASNVQRQATSGEGTAYAATLLMDPSAPTAPNGTGFTYQGRLTSGGNPANGSHDFAFRLYDALAGGSQVGSPISPTAVLTSGLFTVMLDFGPGAFLGDARWMEIRVRPTGGGGYTTLAPRQPITPAPYALSAPWGGISGRPYPYSFLRAPNASFTLDSAGDVGIVSAITVGVDGLGLISYYDVTNGNLKVIHCKDVACTSNFGGGTLDTTGDVGLFTSITVGADGLALISYYDNTNDNLKVAHCGSPTCVPYYRTR